MGHTFEFLPYVASSKRIQDSIGFWISTLWILDSSYWILDLCQLLDSGSLSVEFGFRIPIFGGIPDSLSFIPDSKTQDFGFQRQKFPDSGIRSSLKWGHHIKFFLVLRASGRGWAWPCTLFQNRLSVFN